MNADDDVRAPALELVFDVAERALEEEVPSLRAKAVHGPV
jgi:hypothetical protein